MPRDTSAEQPLDQDTALTAWEQATICLCVVTIICLILAVVGALVGYHSTDVVMLILLALVPIDLGCAVKAYLAIQHESADG